jgi:hypothetical protein
MVLDQRRVSLSDLLKLRTSLEDEAAALCACMEGIRGAFEREQADWARKIEMLRTELGTCEGQKVANYSLLSTRKEANGQQWTPTTHMDTVVYQSIHPPVYLSICLSIYLSVDADTFKEGNTNRDTEVKQWQDIWSERCTVLAAVQSSARQLELEAIPIARTCLQAGIDKVQRTFECEPCYQLRCCQAHVALFPQLVV